MPSWMEAKRQLCHQAIADRQPMVQQALCASRTLACKTPPALDRATQETPQVTSHHKGRRALVPRGKLTYILMQVVQGVPLILDCAKSHQ